METNLKRKRSSFESS